MYIRLHTVNGVFDSKHLTHAVTDVPATREDAEAVVEKLMSGAGFDSTFFSLPFPNGIRYFNPSNVVYMEVVE